MEIKKIDITPSWLAATRIYCMVLQNPKANEKSKKEAISELCRLAENFDNIQRDFKKKAAKLAR